MNKKRDKIKDYLLIVLLTLAALAMVYIVLQKARIFPALLAAPMLLKFITAAGLAL